MSMRKTPRIEWEDYDMPVPVLEEFNNIPPVPPVLANMIGGFVSTTTMTTRRTLAALCIEQAKLCIYIGRVLLLQFLASNESLRSTDENVMMLRPRASGCAAELAKVIKCDQQLVGWYDGLPEDCHHEIRGQDPAIERHGCGNLLVHRILPFCTLHQPPAPPNMATDPMAKSIHRVSCPNVTTAPSDIARLPQELDDRKMSGFLPPVGVTVLVPAMVVHLLEIRSGDENVRKSGWSRFDQCRKVLQRLQESYASADVALALLQLASARVSPGTRPKTQQGGVHSSNGMINGKDVSGTDPGPYSIQAVQASMHGANDADEHSSRGQHQPIETLAQAPTDATDVLTTSHTGLPDYIDDVFDALVNFDPWPGLFTADDGAPADLNIGETLQFPRIGA
ncbi:hypothetical protein LTR56_026712 [Elasticomyces elasticus]|nr:hypothetical protein LTR56_026712 [Elasticomyces elasticus]KAK4902444.1 hypothetical protein LTR49_027040 [Elasticomyces elasticus]